MPPMSYWLSQIAMIQATIIVYEHPKSRVGKRSPSLRASAGWRAPHDLSPLKKLAPGELEGSEDSGHRFYCGMRGTCRAHHGEPNARTGESTRFKHSVTFHRADSRLMCGRR